MAGSDVSTVREIVERLPPEVRVRMRGRVSTIRIEHDDWCLLFNGGRSCTCEPNVRVVRPPNREEEK